MLVKEFLWVYRRSITDVFDMFINGPVVRLGVLDFGGINRNRPIRGLSGCFTSLRELGMTSNELSSIGGHAARKFTRVLVRPSQDMKICFPGIHASASFGSSGGRRLLVQIARIIIEDCIWINARGNVCITLRHGVSLAIIPVNVDQYRNTCHLLCRNRHYKASGEEQWEPLQGAWCGYQSDIHLIDLLLTQ